MSNNNFLAGLVRVGDSAYNKCGDKNLNGFEVTKRKGTILDDAIGEKNAINGKMKIRDKMLQSRKVSRVQSMATQHPTSKTKYVVLDSRAINEIMEMNNAQRRNFLSKLSDSDRRRVLRAIHVKDDLEDGQLKRRDLNRELEPQDLYVINDLLTKFSYSRKDDELRMLESYKDLLDETDGQELAVLTLINKVIDGDLNLDEDADVINDVCDFLEDNGFETDSLQASLTAGFGDTIADEEVDDDVEDDINEDVDVDVEDDGVEDESFEDEGVEDEDVESGLEPKLGDSVSKTKNVHSEKIMDSSKNVTYKAFEEIEDSLIDDSYELALGILKNEVTNIMDSSNKIIAKYTEMTNESVRVKDCFDRSLAHSLSSISEYMTNNVQKVKDDIIDEIDQNLAGESEDENGKTLLESLGSALQAFAEGDSTELQALSELTIDDVQTDDDFNIDDNNEDGDEQEDDNIDEEGDEEEDGQAKSLDLNVDLADSVKNLATALLNKDVKANVYIDKLKDSVEILRKINFKISDSKWMEEEDEYSQSEVDVTEPILTREEFQATYEYPTYVGQMAKEANPACCVNPTAVNYGDRNPIIQVECNGIVQNWIPITGSSNNIAEQLEQEGVDVAKVISDNCVPEDDYYTIASKTNNLGLIDERFYKRKMSDSAWVCDGIADCVADCEGLAEGATFVQSGLTTMPKVVPSGSVLIYGTKYDYYNKDKK